MIVKNGLLALPGEGDFRRLDLRVRGERIAEIARDIKPEEGEEVVDARGHLVFPGAIDPHVHFDEPGFTHREDFLHGTSEAAKGGVTTVIDMPCTSLPPVTTYAAFENKLGIIKNKAVVDYALYGGVSGHTAERSLARDMEELSPKVVGFKCYFISGMETFTSVSHDDFARVVAKAAGLGRPVLLHAEDRDYIEAAQKRLAAARGAAAPTWADYVDSRPEAAELAACAAALALASGHEGSLHIVHVGTAAAAELIAAAGATCETCTHYLAFSCEDFETKGAALKTAPVVKHRLEREALMRLLAQGKISFVTSDHAPAPSEEKNTGNPLTAYGGIPGTGTLFPYLLSEGYFSGKLSLPRFLEAVSANAAKRYGLFRRKGSIAVGMDADLVLVDPAATTTIIGEELLSKGKITPFDGMALKGRVDTTFVRGKAVYSASAKGRILASPGYGKFLTWGYL
jgi:allantoinase